MKLYRIQNSLIDLRMVFLSIFLFLFSGLFANEEIDSLTQIANEYSGLPRIEAKLQLGYLNRRSDYDLANKFVKEAYDEAISLEIIDMQARALYYLGLTNHYFDYSDTALVLLGRSEKLYRQEKDYKNLGKVLSMEGTVSLRLNGDQGQAMAKYNEALVYSRKASDNVNMAIIYSQLSNIFRLDGSFSQAIEFIFKSKEQYELAGEDEGAAWITYSVGRIYSTMDLYEDARSSFEEALERYKMLPKSVSTLTGVAISYDELGMANLKLGDIENARFNNQQAQNIYSELKLQFGMSNACKYKAMIEYEDGNHDIALEYLNRSKKIKKDMSDVLGYPGIYKLYGQIFYSKGDMKSAIDSLNNGLQYAIQNGQKSLTIGICSMLADIYAETGDHEKAYRYRSDQIALSDSISLSSATRAMTQLEVLYSMEAQEKKIQALEQENLVNEMSLEREVTVRNLLLIILSMAVIFAFFMLKLFASNRETNVTLKGNQKSLQELNATKDKFTSIIAHDLKSPFNTLIGFSSLLKNASENKDFEKVTEYSKHIENVSTQTYKLLENLLEWSRSQTGKISFEPKAVDIRFPIQETIELMEPIAQQKQLSFELSITPVVVLADKNMIHTILQNLISNAIKYSNHGSQIKILASESNDMLELCVQDFGIGMDQDKCSQLFHLDDTISEPGTDGERGTGLGLILCKEFVEQHRGKIEVESQLGKGTCFKVYLPL